MSEPRGVRTPLLGLAAALVLSGSVYLLRDYNHESMAGMLLAVVFWLVLVGLSMRAAQRVVEPRLAAVESSSLRSWLGNAWMLAALVALGAVYGLWLVFLLTRPVV